MLLAIVVIIFYALECGSVEVNALPGYMDTTDYNFYTLFCRNVATYLYINVGTCLYINVGTCLYIEVINMTVFNPYCLATNYRHQ